MNEILGMTIVLMILTSITILMIMKIFQADYDNVDTDDANDDDYVKDHHNDMCAGFPQPDISEVVLRIITQERQTWFLLKEKALRSRP